jgi:hypothetical protein
MMFRDRAFGLWPVMTRRTVVHRSFCLEDGIVLVLREEREA